MKNYKLWTSISLFSFCVVGLLGVILRSKILFDLPWIDYLHLLDGHSHFAFGGWVTLALLILLIGELLPEACKKKSIYPALLWCVVISSYGTLLTEIFNQPVLHGLFSSLFILTSYIFGWVYLKDMRYAHVNKTVYLLSVFSIICLILSSVGPIALAYLHAVRSVEPFFYRDAIYIYLHLQYNGFFTLAIFALCFHKLFPKIQKRHQHNYFWFSVLLITSILPSLFLSFLWQDPEATFRVIAVTGSILIFSTATWFVISSWLVLKHVKSLPLLLRIIVLLSIGAFILKMFLQSLTIFTFIGNAVFGDRPIIIGFLHLVFLGFVSPFILAYMAQIKTLSVKLKLTRYALILFTFFAVCNEITLMLQGLGAMFLKSSQLFSYLLWLTSIGLMIGTTLLLASNLKSMKAL